MALPPFKVLEPCPCTPRRGIRPLIPPPAASAAATHGSIPSGSGVPAPPLLLPPPSVGLRRLLPLLALVLLLRPLPRRLLLAPLDPRSGLFEGDAGEGEHREDDDGGGRAHRPLGPLRSRHRPSSPTEGVAALPPPRRRRRRRRLKRRRSLRRRIRRRGRRRGQRERRRRRGRGRWERGRACRGECGRRRRRGWRGRPECVFHGIGGARGGL